MIETLGDVYTLLLKTGLWNLKKEDQMSKMRTKLCYHSEKY